MDRIEAVTFDLDDTLVQYRRSPGEVLRASFERLGVDPMFAVEEYYARYDEFAETCDSMDQLRSDCFAALAAENGFVARLRDDETLVLYPDDWVVDGKVDLERIDDTDRAYEIPLSEKGESWEDVHSYNSDVIEKLSEMEEITETEVSNAEYFVEFVENHYILPVDEVSQKHVREFLEDYYPRNVW